MALSRSKGCKMKRSLIAGAGLLLAIALSGCAGLQIDNFSNGQIPDNGYIVYRPVQYIVVANTYDDEGKISGQSISSLALPNPNEGSAISLQRGFGVGSIELAVEDGWRLSTLNAETENTQIGDFITALNGLRASGRASTNGSSAGLTPGIYRVHYDSNGNAVALVPVPFGPAPSATAANASPASGN
jgi:hypothetical protein